MLKDIPLKKKLSTGEEMILLFGDTYAPDFWIEKMKESGMDQEKAICILNKISFVWCEKESVYLMDDENLKIFLSEIDDDEYYDVVIQGLDMAGSLSQHEQMIINLLCVAYPVVPINIIKQTTHNPLRPNIEGRGQRWGMEIMDGEVIIHYGGIEES